MGKILTTAEVREVYELARVGIFDVHLACPVIASQVKPGQFVTIGPEVETSVMRRPFTVYFSDGEVIRLVFQVVGPNTGQYSRWQRGQQVSVLGPIGQPAVINSKIKCFILVAGGVGLASLHYLAWQIKKKTKARMIVAAGFRTQDHAFGWHDFIQLGREVEFVTEDDSHKTAVDLLRNILRRKSVSSVDRIQVFTCGPRPMMQRVARTCRTKGIPCFVFLEGIMACGGLGACKSDAVLTTKGVKCICQDGPIFKAEEVLWNETIKNC